MTDNKLNELESLNKTLKPPRELSGIFLPSGYEKRFDIVFVAEMPSMSEPKDILAMGGNFNVSVRDRFFQEMMIKYGVAGSYVTDVVKEGDVPRQPTPAEIQKWLPFLLQEIDIVRPKAIIVLGRRTYVASFKPFVEPAIADKNIKIDWVFHYSNQVPRDKFERRFSKVISKMRN